MRTGSGNFQMVNGLNLFHYIVRCRTKNLISDAKLIDDTPTCLRRQCDEKNNLHQ